MILKWKGTATVTAVVLLLLAVCLPSCLCISSGQGQDDVEAFLDPSNNAFKGWDGNNVLERDRNN